MSIENTHSSDHKILSLSGLKVVAMFLIFYWHSDMKKPPVDLGARACEFFFIIAGFLFYYAHYRKPVPCTFSDIFQYTKRKIASIWPIHFLCFLLTLLYIDPANWLSRDGALLAALNLSLTHSFINTPAVYHSFNGVSWFCSSIVFCYLLAPVFARMLRSKKRVPLMLLTSFAVRFMLEWVQTVKPGEYWNLSIHVFPPVRLCEFVMGMSCAALFLSLHMKQGRKTNPILFTALEVGALYATTALLIAKQSQWLRAQFLPPFCLLVLVFAFDSGFISKLFSLRPIQFFAALQLEFFVIHQVMFRLIQHFYPSLYAYPKREFAVCFILTIALALFYRRSIQKPASELVNCLLDKIYRFLSA